MPKKKCLQGEWTQTYLILNIGSRWISVVSINFWPICPCNNNAVAGWMGRQYHTSNFRPPFSMFPAPLMGCLFCMHCKFDRNKFLTRNYPRKGGGYGCPYLSELLPGWSSQALFAKLRTAPVSFVMSICLSAWNNSASTGRILKKIDIWIFLENLPRKFKFH